MGEVCVCIFNVYKCLLHLCIISFSTQSFAGTCRYIMKHGGPDL